jgi:hypothetical protein
MEMGLRKKQLGHDEEVVVELRGHRGSLLLPLFVVAVGLAILITASVDHHLSASSVLKVAGLVLGLLGAVLLVHRVVQWRARVITVTNQRVVVSVAGLRTRRDQVSLDRIVEIQVHQGIVDHLFGRGDVIVELVDGPSVVIPDVSKPEALRRILMRTARLDRQGLLAEASRDHGADESEDLDMDSRFGLDATQVRRASDVIVPRLVTEFDPTPPNGTPAVAASFDQDQVSRLSAIDDLEATGIISPAEALEQRLRIVSRFSR